MKYATKVTKTFIVSLVLMLVFGVELREVLGDDRPTNPDIELPPGGEVERFEGFGQREAECINDTDFVDMGISQKARRCR